MSEQKEPVSYKKYAGVALLSVSIALIYTGALIVFFGEDVIWKFNADEVPISMIEPISPIDPTLALHCENMKKEMKILMDFLDIKNGVIPPDKDMSWADLEYYNRLNTEIFNTC